MNAITPPLLVVGNIKKDDQKLYFGFEKLIDKEYLEYWTSYCKQTESISKAFINMFNILQNFDKVKALSEREQKYNFEMSESKFQKDEYLKWMGLLQSTSKEKIAMIENSMYAGCIPLMSSIVKNDYIAYVSSYPIKGSRIEKRKREFSVDEEENISIFKDFENKYGDIVMVMKIKVASVLPSDIIYSSHRFISRSLFSIIQSDHKNISILLHAFAAGCAAKELNVNCTETRPMDNMRLILKSKLAHYNVIISHLPDSQIPRFEGEETPLYINTYQLGELFFNLSNPLVKLLPN